MKSCILAPYNSVTEHFTLNYIHPMCLFPPSVHELLIITVHELLFIATTLQEDHLSDWNNVEIALNEKGITFC